VTLVGAAHAPSPDVRFGLPGNPGLCSLDAACAPPSAATLAGDAGSRGMRTPSPTVVAQGRLVREAHV